METIYYSPCAINVLQPLGEERVVDMVLHLTSDIQVSSCVRLLSQLHYTRQSVVY